MSVGTRTDSEHSAEQEVCGELAERRDQLLHRDVLSMSFSSIMSRAYQIPAPHPMNAKVHVSEKRSE